MENPASRENPKRRPINPKLKRCKPQNTKLPDPPVTSFGVSDLRFNRRSEMLSGVGALEEGLALPKKRSESARLSPGLWDS